MKIYHLSKRYLFIIQINVPIYLNLARTIEVVGGDINASSWSTTGESRVSRSLPTGSQNTIHLHFLREVKGQDSTTTTTYIWIQMLIFTTQPGLFNSTVNLCWVYLSLSFMFSLSGKYLWHQCWKEYLYIHFLFLLHCQSLRACWMTRMLERRGGRRSQPHPPLHNYPLYHTDQWCSPYQALGKTIWIMVIAYHYNGYFKIITSCRYDLEKP